MKTYNITGLSYGEYVMVLAALAAVSPSGGGSEPFTLQRKIAGQHLDTKLGDSYDKLVGRFATTAHEEYVAYHDQSVLRCVVTTFTHRQGDPNPLGTEVHDDLLNEILAHPDHKKSDQITYWADCPEDGWGNALLTPEEFGRYYAEHAMLMNKINATNETHPLGHPAGVLAEFAIINWLTGVSTLYTFEVKEVPLN
jgi:hypothetical protein